MLPERSITNMISGCAGTTSLKQGTLSPVLAPQLMLIITSPLAAALSHLVVCLPSPIDQESIKDRHTLQVVGELAITEAPEARNRAKNLCFA